MNANDLKNVCSTETIPKKQTRAADKYYDKNKMVLVKFQLFVKRFF